MTLLSNANQDLKGITKISQGHIDQLANLVEEVSSREELLEAVEAKSPNAQIQFVVAQLLVNLSEEKGRYRGGEPTLADTILDQQSRKIKQFKANAYRMTEKQMMVIVNDTFPYLKSF